MIELTDTLQTVYDALGADERSAADLRPLLTDSVGLTAINNRLERLRAQGVLERRRLGKCWVYRRVAVLA